MTECETCNGKGSVNIIDTHYVDRGTKWQRKYERDESMECPDCDGTGTTEDESNE